MLAKWNLINKIIRINENETEVFALAHPDSPWFSGHFPDEPILPGIALMSVVYDAIRQWEKEKGEGIALASLKRIKFTGPVRPGDALLINLKRECINDRLSFNFKINVKKNVVCGGLATTIKSQEEKTVKKEEKNA